MPPVTCHLRYEIDPAQIDTFERFARRWIALVERRVLDGDLEA